MTYSEDLRKRVVEFVKNGGSKSKAARLFGVSRWCVYDWLSRESLMPKKQGCPGAWKLDLAALAAHVEHSPDAYQRERTEVLGVSQYTICVSLKRLGFKKKRFATPKKTTTVVKSI